MPTNNVDALLATDVPDPSDFPPPSALPGLRQLDTTYRCAICGELYDAPITLLCGHCFCSLHITKEEECPTCRKAANEGHFRTNITVEEMLAREHQARISRSKSNRAMNQTPTKRTTPAPKSRKRRQRSNSDGSSSTDIVCVAGPSFNDTNRSSEALDSSPSPTKHVKKKVKSRARSELRLEPSSDPREEELDTDSAVSKVKCPVCRKQVDFNAINKRTMVQNTWWRKQQQGQGQGEERANENADRLPKVTYHVIKDKALKELLVENKLPTSGDRVTWIARHERWVMIYNANLDKSEKSRKTLSELRVELKKWEDNMKGRKAVVDDTEAYQAQNKDEFARLTEQARKSKNPKPKAVSPVQESGSENSETVLVLDSEEEEALKI
ncbi:hypothetical protein SERLADRAFT_441024 [Serpula lacrymans var. lacrymans S7.9]|uniref:RING-type domain-containing protein n=1 Tax=Serpula lacrymans var. lacrymans (strain S7.9) TaxID=578457 RepID=F8P5A5_SERL9|nr:uncharacterized protein SERLADRAFT_441024 [Serpula lacrymans var. lacrymans S7.9]EGO21792.1 hypothetical protein SERLADRAFT_441024 [Serpula lacrymans var. lacrymans S7.9]